VTDGNPFFVTEFLAAGTGGVPATVRDAVLARTASLSPAPRTVVDVAIAGPRAELDLLEAPASGQRRGGTPTPGGAALVHLPDHGARPGEHRDPTASGGRRAG
jgi:hypothetical protein